MPDQLSDVELQCSSQELFTLAALLGAEALVGVSDPFPGWLTEEIQEVMRQAQQRLAEREVLRFVNSQWQMSACIALLLSTLIEPQAVLLANLSLMTGEYQQLVFYARSPFFTELTVTCAESYRLRLLEEGDQVLTRIQDFWQVDAQLSPPAANSFLLPKKTLDQACQVLEQAESLLKPYGMAGETFLHSLHTAQRNGAVVAMRRSATWQVGGKGFLQGENGLWLLRSVQQSGESWVEVIPSDAQALLGELHTLLQLFWVGK